MPASRALCGALTRPERPRERPDQRETRAGPLRAPRWIVARPGPGPAAAQRPPAPP